MSEEWMRRNFPLPRYHYPDARDHGLLEVHREQSDRSRRTWLSEVNVCVKLENRFLDGLRSPMDSRNDWNSDWYVGEEDSPRKTGYYSCRRHTLCVQIAEELTFLSASRIYRFKFNYIHWPCWKRGANCRNYVFSPWLLAVWMSISQNNDNSLKFTIHNINTGDPFSLKFRSLSHSGALLYRNIWYDSGCDTIPSWI